MPKVLLIDPSLFTPAYDLFLMRGLAEAGVEAQWLGCRDIWGMLDGYPEKPREYFYQAAHRLFGRSRSPLRQAVKLAGHVRAMSRLGAFARSNGFRLLHFQWAPVPGLDHFFWTGMQKRGMKIVYTVHNLLPHRPSPGDREKYARLYRLADRLIVHDSGTAKGLVREFGLGASKVSVIPMPALPLPGRAGIEKDEIKRMLGLEGRRIALCFGFIEHYKGFDLAVEAVASAQDQIPADAALVIAGRDDVGQAQLLNSLIKRHGLEERVVLMIGYMEQSFLKSLMAAAELCLFPYREISQSAALLTAMSEGKAVIGFEVGGIGESVEHGRNGLLVPPGDTAAMGRALAQVFGQASLCQQMGQQSAALAEQKHSYLEAGRRTLELYRELQS